MDGFGIKRLGGFIVAVIDQHLSQRQIGKACVPLIFGNRRIGRHHRLAQIERRVVQGESALAVAHGKLDIGNPLDRHPKVALPGQVFRVKHDDGFAQGA